MSTSASTSARPNGGPRTTRRSNIYFRAGKADVLLIVCVYNDEPLLRGDLLTSRALSGFPTSWLVVRRLREVGLLPPAIGARSIARQHAIALHERRFSCSVIVRRLDAEGYAAPNTAHPTCNIAHEAPRTP